MKRKLFDIKGFHIILRHYKYSSGEHYSLGVYDAEYNYCAGDHLEIGALFCEWRKKLKFYIRAVEMCLIKEKQKEIIRTGGIINLSQITGEK